jgi:two-component system LytT family response regulator
MLKSLCSNVNVVAHAEDLNEAAIIVKNMHVPLDVAFLDIKLPDGLVFEWLEKLDKINFDIIFITAFNEYTNKAFDYASVGYVLNPK